MKQKKISFLISCKGRLHHLKDTLPRNLVWNKDYPNVEFILLDYDSPDGLENWIKTNYLEFINSGYLTYYKLPNQKHFKYSYARNILLRLATGDIVCNLDADNYTGNNFANYINEQLIDYDFIIGGKFENEVMGLVPMKNDEISSGAFGRIACKKDRIYKLGGYNEMFEHWGYEDSDLYWRLINDGNTWNSIDPKHLFSIIHNDHDRTRYTKEKNILMNGDPFLKVKQISNNNIENNILTTNNGKFGLANVFKNFNYNTPISIT